LRKRYNRGELRPCIGLGTIILKSEILSEISNEITINENLTSFAKDF